MWVNEVGDDPVKRMKLVNEIAESISKINKAEDFSLQNYYTREDARKLNVDETGLVNLIHKYIRDRIENDQKDVRRDEVIPHPEHQQGEPEPELKVPEKDEQQEWQLLRILIENCHLPYEGYESVAKLIEDCIGPDLIKETLVQRLFMEYFSHYAHFGNVPELHFFINYTEQSIRDIMPSLLHPRQEIISRWKEKYGIESPTGAMTYINDVESTMSYFELKKILLIHEKLTTMLNEEKYPIAQQVMQEKFMKLCTMERDILKRHRQVVFKSNKYK
jgi:DNA primase